jgi:hypothetical protein
VLHTIANTTTGCPVVLVGDYHYSDLKVVLPGPQQPYAAELRSARLKKPVYQVRRRLLQGWVGGAGVGIMMGSLGVHTYLAAHENVGGAQCLSPHGPQV